MIFLDRSIPRSVARGLQAVRGDVFWLEDVEGFRPDTPDQEWVQLVGERGWLAITRDKQIRSTIAEREAVREYGAGLFVLAHRRNLDKWATFQIIVCGLDRMIETFASTPRPFLYAVYQDGKMKRMPL